MKKQLLTLAFSVYVLVATSCSSDENSTVNAPINTGPEEKTLSVIIKPENSDCQAVLYYEFIQIDKLTENGQWVRLHFQIGNNIVNNMAKVHAGDKIRISYGQGLPDNYPCLDRACIQYQFNQDEFSEKICKSDADWNTSSLSIPYTEFTVE